MTILRTAPPALGIRAVIFDRDGVLTHFDFAPVRALLGDLHFPLSEARERWHGFCARNPPPSSEEAERRLLAGFWGEVADHLGLGSDWRARFAAFDYTSTLRPFADARPALTAVRRRGLHVGVLSNFPMASLRASLATVGLLDLVDVAAAAPVIGAAKPAPEAYLHVLEALGVAPHECVLVDDEAPCVAGARALGIHAYLLDRRPGGDGERERGTVSTLDALVAEIDSLRISTSPSPGGVAGGPLEFPQSTKSVPRQEEA